MEEEERWRRKAQGELRGQLNARGGLGGEADDGPGTLRNTKVSPATAPPPAGTRVYCICTADPHAPAQNGEVDCETRI